MLYVIILLFICVLLWHWLRFLKRRNEKLRIQKHVLEEHQQEFAKQEQQMWRLKDELSKRIALVNLSSNKMETEELLKYKEELYDYYNDYNMIDYCGSAAVNAVIHSNMQVFSELGATTEIGIHDINMDMMPAGDLFELFYQIFQIGVEACKRKKLPIDRFFYVKTKRIAGQFVVEVRCSVSGNEMAWNKSTKQLKILIKDLGGNSLQVKGAESGMIILSVPLERGE